MIAATPEPPYFVVVFTSQRTPGDQGYADMGARMFEMAQGQPGFLGAESVRNAEGAGITVSYWRSAEAIAAWKADAEHRVAQELGQQRWYSHYSVRIARVERAYDWHAAPLAAD
ncbi:MAG: antibiotic biosynthesis monooxygenase [Xanthomonadales bacterium]|nr:antibiotic biosynthesis monooxygenase [Xanthomonadales bacterium]MBK7146457.1 antibiotic biosynthesis monooxygenase [Xanthomonadales bacterium]